MFSFEKVLLTKFYLVRLLASPWIRLMGKPYFQSTWFHGDPTTETSHSRVSDSQLHFREPWNLQSQLRLGASDFEVPRLAEIGHKLFLFMLIISRGKTKKQHAEFGQGLAFHFGKTLKFQNLFSPWRVFTALVLDLAMLEFSMNGILTAFYYHPPTERTQVLKSQEIMLQLSLWPSATDISCCWDGAGERRRSYFAGNSDFHPSFPTSLIILAR